MVDKDALFDELSKKFPVGNYTAFCSQMGVDYNEARSRLTRFKEDYNVALRDLLSQWDLKMKGVTRKQLEDALDKAEVGGFCSIVKKHYEKGEHGEMPDLRVQRLREKLKARYIEEFSEVKVSPMDPQSRTWLQNIFVSLILIIGCNRNQGQPIGYENLFSFIQTKTEKGFITRVAFLGEAGMGKSTLFAKIALDWAMGKCLQDITLLFHESFRDIEDSPFFGKIVMNHFLDGTEIIEEWIDEYIKENQRKVLILLDGLDEAKMDIKYPNRKLAIVPIVRREKFIDTPVLISTRPFGADQIKSIPKIHEKYSYIQVEGFTKENTNEYINKFFHNDTASASSLIHFMNTNSLVSRFMAPFPIFCCMLCYMWRVESKRKTTEKLQTVSHVIKEIDFALREQYSSKFTDTEGGYQGHMEKAAEAIVKVGFVAFGGLLQNQRIFTKEEIQACDEAAVIACQVGLLSGETKVASKEIRQREGKQFIQEFCFPHKLLQEYSASLYLASLYKNKRSVFDSILTDKLIKDYKEFRYVLYFTAAHGGEVGKSVLEALCKKVDDMEFIIEVAFECHDSEAIDPVINLLKVKTRLQLNPLAAYLFTLETIGKEVVRRSPSIRERLGGSESFKAYASSSYVAAVGLFTLHNIRSLTIISQQPDDEFYTGMSAAASHSEIEELSHLGTVLGSAASSHYARGLCCMPNLLSLGLTGVKLSDEFYSTMASEASKSKIQILSIWSLSMITPSRLHSILSLPSLHSLTLRYITRFDTDNGETLTRPISSLHELSVDGMHVISLWNLGLHTSCPRVQKLQLDWSAEENVSPDIVTMACCPFHHLTHLCIQGIVTMGIATRMNDPVSFCKAVTTSCPRLFELSIKSISLYNKNAAEIIQLMKTHPHLTSIELDSCGTNTDLDPLISEVNSEGKLTVTAKHGGFNTKLYIEKAAKISQLMETHPHPTSIDGQTSRKTHGFDDVIIKVANAVSDDDDIRRLGLELGVQTPDINRALETDCAGGTKTSNGYVMILQNWAETVKPSKQLPVLRAALQAAGLTEIEETSLPKKNKYHDEGIFDQTGGELHVPAHGVNLCIPSGALQEGSSEMITLDVLTDIPPEITLRHDETPVTYGFQCLPSGLQFLSEKPVTLKIPHCANLIDPTKVQVVLYIWNHEGKADRIVQTSRTCQVTCNHVEILLEHFTIGIVAFIRNALSMHEGRRMSFMPFLPKIMPQRRNEIPLQFRMVNKPHGTSWKDVHDIGEEAKYQPAKDVDDEMYVKSEDMVVTCQLDDNDTCRKNVDASFIRKTTHIVYFPLDFVGKADDLLVTLEVIQSMIPMEIMFTTHFRASPFASITSGGMYMSFYMRYFLLSVNDNSRGIIQTLTSSASTSAAIPPQGASAGADEVSTSQTSDAVSDGQLTILADQVPPGKYYHLAAGLGIRRNKASAIREEHGIELAMGECLSVWKNKTGGSFAELNRIFNNNDLGGLLTNHMK